MLGVTPDQTDNPLTPIRAKVAQGIGAFSIGDSIHENIVTCQWSFRALDPASRLPLSFPGGGGTNIIHAALSQLDPL